MSFIIYYIIVIFWRLYLLLWVLAEFFFTNIMLCYLFLFCRLCTAWVDLDNNNQLSSFEGTKTIFSFARIRCNLQMHENTKLCETAYFGNCNKKDISCEHKPSSGNNFFQDLDANMIRKYLNWEKMLLWFYVLNASSRFFLGFLTHLLLLPSIISFHFFFFKLPKMDGKLCFKIPNICSEIVSNKNSQEPRFPFMQT